MASTSGAEATLVLMNWEACLETGEVFVVNINF